MADAARKMRDLRVGALPICGDDNRLRGMLSDIARNMDDSLTGQLVEAISSARSNN